MRKFKVIVLTLILWLGGGSVLVFSQADTNLSGWFQNTIKSDTQKTTRTVTDDSKAIEEQMLQQLDDEMKTIEREIDQINQSNTRHTEQELEDYKEDYLKRLDEIQETLLQADFETYAENRKKQIDQEITEDVEVFLADLLSD